MTLLLFLTRLTVDTCMIYILQEMLHSVWKKALYMSQVSDVIIDIFEFTHMSQKCDLYCFLDC